jgi:putative ABC transport system permease protein
MEALIRDIKYAFRRLLSQPGSSLIILLTLAFGIGANTSIFSLVNGVVFRDLPFKRGGDIVEVRQQALKVGVENVSASVLEIQDYREQASSLEGLVEYHFMYFFIGGDAPALVKTGIVSANYFDFLGVVPVLGRGFVASDDKPGAEPVILLSHEVWNSQFGGDEKVIGRIVEMNGKANRIIGVLPKIPHFPEVNDIYMPTSGCPMRADPEFAANRSSRMMSVYGRLKPGVELGQAASEVGLIAQRLQSSHPTIYPENIGFDAKVLSLQDELTKDIRPSLYLLLAASLLLLLITCANVVNLTLAQQSKRQKELAVRAALGADRRDIARKLLIESMVLALTGGLGGLVLAYFSLDLLTSFASTFTSRASEVSIDGTALAFNLIVSILTGVVVGLVPVFGKQDIVTGLKEGGAHATLSRQRQAVRKILIVAQIAVAFMLVTGAGLMIRSFVTLQAIDPGFKSEGVTAVTVPLNWSKYETPDSGRNFVREMKTELEGSPEVDGVAFTTAYPFGNGVGTSLGGASLSFDDRPGDAGSTRVNSRAVSGNYFELLGIPLIEGRSISNNDDERAPLVVVINKTMAEKYWPDQSALNKRISPDEGKTWYSVVGVTGDVKGAALDKPVVEEFYVSYAQSPSQSVNVLIKSQADASRISTLVRGAVSRLDPEQPVTKVITLQQALAETMSSPRMLSQVLSLFSFIALAISMAGVSGLLAYTVSQRTKEIGIRMALGAEPGFVRRLVLRQGLMLVFTGLTIGIVASLALGRLMSSLMYGTSSMDPATYLVVSLVVLIASLGACWLPATRASRLDPSGALRTA